MGVAKQHDFCHAHPIRTKSTLRIDQYAYKLIKQNVFVTSPWFTYAGWNQFVPLLLLLLLTILTKYHSKNLGSNPWDIREKKMFCPSCLCNFCPAECPHLVRALYYLWPINRVLYFFKVIEVRYACFWGNNLSILYVEETFSYFKRYLLKNLLAFLSCKGVEK